MDPRAMRTWFARKAAPFLLTMESKDRRHNGQKKCLSRTNLSILFLNFSQIISQKFKSFSIG